jgi:hypothetical protein
MRPLEVALVLASQGIASFPCSWNKAPTKPAAAGRHGYKDATTDPQMLRALWRDFPGDLVGVPSGAINDFDVLDIDRKHDEARGWWVENRARLPATRTHRTRAGGLHLLFKYVPGLKCSASRIAPGVDIRTNGGYIVWWPAAEYPILCDGPIAALPRWLIEALRPPPSPIKPKASAPSINGNRRALCVLIRTVMLAKEGERNSTTFWAACRAAEMIATGDLTYGEAISELAAAAIYVGLPEQEAVRTIHSGLARR